MNNRYKQYCIERIILLNIMLPLQKRQRIINLPKGVSRTNFLSERSNSKQSSDSLNSAHLQFSFNLNENEKTQDQLNITNQYLTEGSPKRTLDNLYTINPQRVKNRVAEDEHFSLRNKSSPRKQHFLNTFPLKVPLVQDTVNRELIEKQENLHEMSHLGNSHQNIRKQKPLKQQAQTGVVIVDQPKKLSPMDKLQKSEQIISEYKKQQSTIFYREKSKIFPNLTRAGISEPDGILRLSKRQSDIEAYTSNLQIQTVRDRFEKKKNIIQYGHLIPENKISKIKEEINQIVSDKSKGKSKISQSRMDEELNMGEKKRPSSNLFWSENNKRLNLENSREEFSHYMDTDEGIFAYRKPDHKFFSAPKNIGNRKSITVSYKTSLNQLKQIYKTISQNETGQIEVLVPKVLMNTYFEQNLDKTELHNHAKYLFTCLGIPINSLSIKKYSNCILMIAKNICILWHYDGKVYLGGWQFKYLDEGVKHGLGLQWVPNQYVYYGEYSESKKAGLGILKTKEQTFIGEWTQGRKTENGCLINRNGEIFHPRLSFDGGNKQTPNEVSLESDPFM